MGSRRMLILMAQRIGLVSLLLSLAVLFTMVPAQAEVITFQLQVVPTFGLGVTGTFAIDSSIIPPDGGQVVSPSFTDMDFTWAGIHYTAIQTSFLTFDSAGNLVAWNFGTNCDPPGDGGCSFILLPPFTLPPGQPCCPCCPQWLVNTAAFEAADSYFGFGPSVTGTATVTRLTPVTPPP